MPLFEGIISDLFPGTPWPNPDYGVLLEAMKDNCAKRNLQATEWYMKKVIQVRVMETAGRPTLPSPEPETNPKLDS